MLFEERLLNDINFWMKDEWEYWLDHFNDQYIGDENGVSMASQWDVFLRKVECFFARQRRGANFYYTNGESPYNTRLINLHHLKHEVEESIKRQKSIYKENDGNR